MQAVEEGSRRSIMQDLVAHYKDVGLYSKYNGKLLMNYNQRNKMV